MASPLPTRLPRPLIPPDELAVILISVRVTHCQAHPGKDSVGHSGAGASPAEQPVSVAREFLNIDSGATKSVMTVNDPFFLYLTILFMVIFSVLFSVSIWRYKKNKPQKL